MSDFPYIPSPNPLCQREQSVVLVLDIQEKLANAMPETDRDRVVERSGILLQAAGLMEIPFLYSEQYPKGLGRTAAGLQPYLANAHLQFEKTAFSCCRVRNFFPQLQKMHRKQVVVAGMEAHICVLQTVMDLIGRGYQPFVVADAVCSRHPEEVPVALDRFRQQGAVVTTTESVLFEWLRDAQSGQFKSVTQLIR